MLLVYGQARCYPRRAEESIFQGFLTLLIWKIIFQFGQQMNHPPLLLLQHILSKVITGKFLYKQLLHSYHINKLHAMGPNDNPPSGVFVLLEIIRRLAVQIYLLTKHNLQGRNYLTTGMQVWAEENPLAVCYLRHQQHLNGNSIYNCYETLPIGRCVFDQKITHMLST